MFLSNFGKFPYCVSGIQAALTAASPSNFYMYPVRAVKSSSEGNTCGNLTKLDRNIGILLD